MNTLEKKVMKQNEILVAYFSHTGENYSVGVIEKGNTEIIAEMIAEQTGSDIFEIKPAKPYPHNYNECIDVAKKELNRNARPELAENIEIGSDKKILFLGYPNWWAEMPMAVFTFLESHDFSGMKIAPFCTNEGSGLSGTERSIAKACPDAEVLKGLSIQGSVVQNNRSKAKEAVEKWINNLGL
jgi:flavodoxin